MKRPRSAPPELRTGAFLVCGLFSGVNPYGLLPPRSIQGIWNGWRLDYELGLKNLNGWVPLLGAQALLVAITLGLGFPLASKKASGVVALEAFFVNYRRLR